MDLLEEVLKKLWPRLVGAHWINVDTCGPNIGGRILQLRMRGENIDPTPIILYGFRSFESLVRAEEKYPRLLVSQGVYYRRLPAMLKEVDALFEHAQGFKADPTRMNNDLMEHTLVGSQLSRMESSLAHNQGNFLGSEKLLYGVHLAHMITGDQYKEVLEKIRGVQIEFLKGRASSSEYLMYRLMQTNYKAQNISQIASPQFKGRILYIDDHARLGWGTAVACALFGKMEALGSPVNSKLSQYIHGEQYKSSDGGFLKTLSVAERSDEEGYIEGIKELLTDSFLRDFDMILLDLRLRWQEDENEIEKNISGFEILRQIREENAAIPVVMLTASRKAINMDTVFEMGADAYFIKGIPQIGEPNDEILSYVKHFGDTINGALEKAYLGEIWRSVIDLEKLYKDRRENTQDILPFFKKSIALLRKQANAFESESLCLNTIGEAILNLGLIVEIAMDAGLGPVEPYVDKGFLLKGLRNFSAHRLEDTLNDDDAKIALYLTFRFLTNDNSKLKRLSNALFGTISNTGLEYNEIEERARNELWKLIKSEISGNLPQNWEISNRNEIETATSGIPNRLLLPSKNFKNIHYVLRENKRAHYIMFLCRIKSDEFSFGKYLESDHYVLRAIWKQASIEAAYRNRQRKPAYKESIHDFIGKRLQGRVKADKLKYGFIKPDNESIPDVLVHYSNISEPDTTSLTKGQSVEFTLRMGMKGPIGKEVRLVKNSKKPG